MQTGFMHSVGARASEKALPLMGITLIATDWVARLVSSGVQLKLGNRVHSRLDVRIIIIRFVHFRFNELERFVNPSKTACLELDCAPRLLEELETRVQGKLCGRIRELQLLLQDRGIVLRGFARSYHAKQLAQHAVMAETTMPIVANEIEVC